MTKNEKVFRDVSKVYLENEIDNWEWSYQELVELMVSEFSYEDIEDLLVGFTENQSIQLFEKYLIYEIERFTSLDTIARDKINDKILETLRIETKNIELK